MAGTPKKEFEVVFVCTGNRFRSPLAAALLRRAVASLPIRVSSLGTLDVRPGPAEAEAIAFAEELGEDLLGHRSRTVAGENLEAADLVIGFERMHVVTAVVDAHARRDRTFTLPELVELLDRVERGTVRDPVAHARRQLELAAGLRPTDPSQMGSPELEDPLGLPEDEQRRVAETIVDLTGRLTASLFGLPGS